MDASRKLQAGALEIPFKEEWLLLIPVAGSAGARHRNFFPGRDGFLPEISHS
jgi:hypothetical protein